MNRKLLPVLIGAAMLASGFPQGASAVPVTGIKITEWMYNSNAASTTTGGEFVELTNFGSSPINMSGWSFDDNSRAPGSESLSAFGTIGVGQSVILTEMSAANFRSVWGLASSVKIVGGITNNLGRSDEINIYDASNALVDQLTYNDQGSGTVKGPRTSGASAVPQSLAYVGANDASHWVLSSVGDVNGSWKTAAGDIGNPGYSSLAPVPEPGTYAMLLAGLGLVGFAARRRQSKTPV